MDEGCRGRDTPTSSPIGLFSADLTFSARQILRVLKSNGLAPQIPEDLYCLASFSS